MKQRAKELETGKTNKNFWIRIRNGIIMLFDHSPDYVESEHRRKDIWDRMEEKGIPRHTHYGS